MDTNYYILFKSWKMDANQWSIFSGLVGISLTFLGFGIAFCIYEKQRKDNAKDAFDFFQSSLPELSLAIGSAIANINKFTNGLNEGQFSNPALPASLNDNFIAKINIVDLNRFYKSKRSENYRIFYQLILDSNFFGNYHDYFTNELNYFRNSYLEKEKMYSKWQLLRSNKFFSIISDRGEDLEFKNFYSDWIKQLNSDDEVFEMDEGGKPVKVKNRKKLVEKHIIKLANIVYPFIRGSEKANDINLMANEVISAYNDMEAITQSIINVMNQDVEKFKSTLKNLNTIIEEEK